MGWFDIHPPHLFRVPPGKGTYEKLKSLVKDEGDIEEKEEDYLLCRQCLQFITSKADMIEVQRSHWHTFANPEGILFEIGCFRKAKGCWYVGPAIKEFSWFTGFSWRVAICSKCLTHLGWLYTSFDDESFHGLILDRLVSSQNRS